MLRRGAVRQRHRGWGRRGGWDSGDGVSEQALRAVGADPDLHRGPGALRAHRGDDHGAVGTAKGGRLNDTIEHDKNTIELCTPQLAT